jgi:hypothetical protein
MNEIEIPPYFLCPISFQIMKDLVSTVIGITYDRESIEKWLMKAKNCVSTNTPTTTKKHKIFDSKSHTSKANDSMDFIK